MSETVKVTQKAHDDAAAMLRIINNELQPQFKKLKGKGDDMAQPQNWDGPKAKQFRNDVWPKVSTDLDKMRDALTDLHKQVKKILDDIQVAGS